MADDENEVSVEAIEIADVLGGGHTADGRFVAVVNLREGGEQGLMMSPGRLDALSSLLQAALIEMQGHRLSFSVPASFEGKHEVAELDVASTPQGTFRFALKDRDDNTVEIGMSLEKAIEWRDALSAHIERMQQAEG